MAEKLQIIIDAQDRFSGPFRKLRASMPSLRTAALAAGAAFAALGSAAGVAGAKFIKLASDMEETTNKFNVVFRDQIDLATQWAEEISESYFTSREEARRFLSSIQDLLVPMGMNSKAAGELSNQIVRLGADLGSFNNIPTERVLLDIQSALVGNYETMKKYGVVLTATAVQQRALQDGLADSKEELTAADKALTAYKIILESSQAAVGDMARSANSWANQMKLLRAQLTDVGTEIGQVLLPVASQYLNALNQWIKANKDLIVLTTAQWLRNVADMLIAVGRALKWVDDNITDKIIEFFYGPTKSPSKMELLQRQIKQAEENIHDYYLRMAEGEPVEESFLKLQRDKIALLKQEIAELGKKQQIEKAEVKAPEIGEIAPIKAPQLDLPAFQIPEVKLYDQTKTDIQSLKDLWAQYYLDEGERIEQWYKDQQALHKENFDALYYLNEIYRAKKEELATKEAEEEAAKLQVIRDLHTEHFATEQEKLMEWYEQQREQYAAHQEELALIDEIYADRKAQIEEALQQKKAALQDKAFSDTIASMKAFGKQGFAIAKSFEIVQATMAAYRAFVNTLATASEYFLPPIPQVMAGAALAAGLARVAAIAATKYGGAAHGGLNYVPREQTYTLDRGERVVSPKQNRDLTEFLERTKDGGFGMSIGELNLNIMAPSPIQDMRRSDWRTVAEDQIVPVLRELANRGIKA